MEIRSFSVGQTAYGVALYPGRNKEPELTEWVVDSVGRKYVKAHKAGHTSRATTTFELPFKSDANNLVEKSEYSRGLDLFASKEEAKEYIESHLLRKSIRSSLESSLPKLSLDQLRQISKLLTVVEE